MSKTLTAATSICFLQLRRWFRKPEVCVMLTCIAIFMSSRLIPVRDLIQATGVSATPYVLPFLFSDSQMAFFITAGSVILFLDAPFWHDSQACILVRVGRKNWIAGQLLYIFTASVLYIGIVTLLSLCMLLPYLQPSATWGIIWNTIAQTDAAMQFNINLGVSYTVISQYTPLAATLLQFLLGTLVSSMLGFLLFLLHLTVNKKIGLILAAILVLFPLRIYTFPSWVLWLFPTTWCNLDLIRQEKTGLAPTVREGFWWLVLLHLIFLLLILLLEKRRDLK